MDAATNAAGVLRNRTREIATALNEARNVIPTSRSRIGTETPASESRERQLNESLRKVV